MGLSSGGSGRRNSPRCKVPSLQLFPVFIYYFAESSTKSKFKMADDDVSSEIFDPSLKKKKKKKTGFNLDAALSEAVNEVSEPAAENGEAEDRENKEDTPDMDDVFGKKTKKKKKKAFNFDEMNDALPDTSAPMGDNEETNGDAGNEVDDLDMTMDFTKTKKKKT